MTFVIDGETVRGSRSVNVTVLRFCEGAYTLKGRVAAGEFGLLRLLKYHNVPAALAECNKQSSTN